LALIVEVTLENEMGVDLLKVLERFPVVFRDLVESAFNFIVYGP